MRWKLRAASPTIHGIFEIIPKAGWFSDQQLSLGIAIATIIGIMAAYACWELMNRHQKDLQHEAALEKVCTGGPGSQRGKDPLPVQYEP